MEKSIFTSKNFWIGVVIGLVFMVIIGGESAIVYIFHGFMFMYSLWLINLVFEGWMKKRLDKKDKDL